MRRLDARSGVRDESFIAPPVLKQDAEKRRRHTIGAPAASPSLGGFHVRPLVETKLALGLRAQSVDRLEFAFSLVVPEGPAVAGRLALDKRTQAMDGCLVACVCQ
jgi:hypothetical protein